MASNTCSSWRFTSTITTLLFYTLLSSPQAVSEDYIFIHSINSNFTTNYLKYIDNGGAFLASQNHSFQARITQIPPESLFFYLVIVHVSSNTTIWSANRNLPITQSSVLHLTSDGLSLYDETGHPIWSTPQKLAHISSLQLLESGNLVLLDDMDNTVWKSFDFPTDTLVMGQKLLVGKSLVSSTSDEDLSEGSYRLMIGDDEAMLQWNGMNYWMLSMDVNAFRYTYGRAKYLLMNFTGVYIIGEDDSEILIQLPLQNSNVTSTNSKSFRFIKLQPEGSLIIVNIDRYYQEVLLKLPVDFCRIPAICGTLGVCVRGEKCVCSPGFYNYFEQKNESCLPIDTSVALPSPCHGNSSVSGEIKYLNLGGDLDYFSNDLVGSGIPSMNLSSCQNLCSSNCSCLAVFHSRTSGSCYMIRDHLGSMFNKSHSYLDRITDRTGYIKTIGVVSNANTLKRKMDFPVLAVVLPLSLGAILIGMVPILVWLRRKRKWGKRSKDLSLGKFSSASEEREILDCISDLPNRFEYSEIATVTGGFSTKIGSGGFGTVYKGTLEGTTDVAVKKINSLGVEGKREFLSEIATIGKIRHVNLVKLKGFCVHKEQRFLIYEYMNRGSLDQALFHGKPLLKWTQRYKIALGTARALKYLHTGCEQRIIHCDVKPENILLNDKLQVKVSDFGLSKLLNRELSGFFTTLRGTRGYIAPEWLTHIAISDKTDVYSYGMVLLEIIRGMRNFFLQSQSNTSRNTSSDRQINFPLRAFQMHVERRYLDLVDPRLMGEAPSEEVEKLVRVALCCLHREPNLRPSMSDVVLMLEGGMGLSQPRIDSLRYLRNYSTEVSAENNEQNEGVAQLNDKRWFGSHNLLSYISSHQVSGPR